MKAHCYRFLKASPEDNKTFFFSSPRVYFYKLLLRGIWISRDLGAVDVENIGLQIEEY